MLDYEGSISIAENVLGCSPSDAGVLSLDLAVWPPAGVVAAARFPEIDVVCSREFARSRPSELTEQISELAVGRNACGVFMHSADDWAAFAVWSGGHLIRSMSVASSSGIIEDLGEQLSFEAPFWGGQSPCSDEVEYALTFHPIDLGNDAFREFFGFILEGHEDEYCIDPEEVEIPVFRTENVCK